MADLRDDQGRPVQLTDELGRPVQLTDEHGVPIHLTGVATTTATTIGSELHDKTAPDDHATMGSKTHGGTHFAPTPVDYVKRGGEAVAAAVTGSGAPASQTQAHGVVGEDKKQPERSTSSSSSSSEDDGEGGRRKKKGLKQKIKEKLPGHGHGEKETSTGTVGAAHSIDTKATSTTTGVGATAAGQQHQKKGFIDKIKDKLPGHH